MDRLHLHFVFISVQGPELPAMFGHSWFYGLYASKRDLCVSCALFLVIFNIYLCFWSELYIGEVFKEPFIMRTSFFSFWVIINSLKPFIRRYRVLFYYFWLKKKNNTIFFLPLDLACRVSPHLMSFPTGPCSMECGFRCVLWGLCSERPWKGLWGRGYEGAPCPFVQQVVHFKWRCVILFLEVLDN